MAKVHITLVGGQPAPVYKGIIDEHPDTVILVCSNDSVELAGNVQKYACEKIDGLQCEQVQISPVSIPEIRKKINKIASSLSGDDIVTVNISGGTKVWSILFYDSFKDKADCIFIDQNDNKYNLTTELSKSIYVQLDIKTILGLNYIDFTSHSLTEYSEEDFKAAQTVRDMRRRFPVNFNKLMDDVENHPGAGYWCIDDLNYLSYNKNEKTCTMSLSNNRRNKVEKKKISSPHIQKVMFNTGWFELEVAKMLSQWEHAQEIAMNCYLRSSKEKNSLTLNEIDIIINVHEKLLFVECKTQIKDATDVDKFNNAIRLYGGLSAKGVFVTDAEMKPQAKAKCDTAGILTFSMQKLRETGNVDIQKLFKELMFNEIDKHMGGLNIR